MLDRSACACAAKTAAADSARCGNRRPANAKLLSGASWTPKTGHSSALLASCGASLSTAGTSSARSAFCTNFRSFAPPPPYESIACAERRFHTCRPRSGRKFSTDGQEAHSKLKKEVKKGSGSVRMTRSIIPAMPRCSPGGRASSPQGASPQCASSHDCGTHLSGTVWLGRNMLLSWSPQCAQPSSLYTITCHGPRQGC